MNLKNFISEKKENKNYDLRNIYEKEFGITDNYLNINNNLPNEQSYPNMKYYTYGNFDINSNINPKKDKYISNKSFNKTFSNFYHNLYPKSPTNTLLLNNELHSLKIDYVTLKNDNIICREDINKLLELNKHLEKCLEEERNHNYELAKENDMINNEKQNLYRKIDEVNQKISQIKSISSQEKCLINKQKYLEEKINEKEFRCKVLSEENNKLKNEYNLLNEKFIKLQEKNNKNEIELNDLKIKQEEKLNNIEEKIEILLEQINSLKSENNKLKIENDNYKNKIMNKEKEKDEFYYKYKEQKIQNEMINKEKEDVQKKYIENKKLLETNERNKIIQEKIRKNNSEHKIRVIKDLQSKIQRYKTLKTNKMYDNENDSYN